MSDYEYVALAGLGVGVCLGTALGITIAAILNRWIDGYQSRKYWENADE